MGRNRTLNDQYFSWLYNRIKNQKRSYIKLSKELHNKAFRWSIRNDDNRGEDGLNLRDLFIDEENLDESHLELRYFLKAECTIFEMLVALSERIDNLMYDLNNQEDYSSKWFLEMLKNLKLDKYNDNFSPGERFDEMTETRINEILEIFMDRTYDYYGRGGLFPIKKQPPTDQTGVEIWYQLMLYLDENYN